MCASTSRSPALPACCVLADSSSVQSSIQKLYKNGFNLDPLSSGSPQAYFLASQQPAPAAAATVAWRRQASKLLLEIQNFREEENTTKGDRDQGEKGKPFHWSSSQLPIVLRSQQQQQPAPSPRASPALSLACPGQPAASCSTYTYYFVQSIRGRLLLQLASPPPSAFSLYSMLLYYIDPRSMILFLSLFFCSAHPIFQLQATAAEGQGNALDESSFPPKVSSSESKRSDYYGA